MRIVPSDFTNPLVIDLLRTHVTTARAETAAGSAHALDLSALQRPIFNAGPSGRATLCWAWPYFHPAHRVYKSHGFVESGPFGDYVLDPHSVFMSLDLREQH